MILLRLAALFFCCYFLAKFCNAQTDGFSIARIHSDLTPRAEWEVPALGSEERQAVCEILAQPFHYLGCGGQAFAFVSEDGKYVLKFFKHKIRKPYSYFYTQPLPKLWDHVRQKKWQKAWRKTERDFNSYKIAYESLKEESGLLYVHLNKTPDLGISVTITDKLGIKHVVSLDEVECLLQKKATLAYEYIETLIRKKEPRALHGALGSVLQSIVTRCQKGVFDEDPRLHRNLGFVKDQPIFIDVGRFVLDESRKNPSVYTQDLFLITKRFRHFLEDNYPDLVSILDEEIKAYEVL